MSATALGLLLVPVSAQAQLPAQPTAAAPDSLPLSHYRPILTRDIFNSAGNAQTFSQAETNSQSFDNPPQTSTKWQLIGTISGGPLPMAMLTAGAETASYRLDEELPDGSRLAAVERNRVELRQANGQVLILEISQDAAPVAAAPTTERSARPARPASATGTATATASATAVPQVEALDDNQWLIPAEVAENARTNIGDLLKQAQAIPYLEDNQTTGFEIKMIQPGSFIAQLGLQKGDILREINGVALDSPEKALQVFGQLRQATQISIGLERRGKAMTFAYEIR